jgi:hypothetical protein
VSGHGRVVLVGVMLDKGGVGLGRAGQRRCRAGLGRERHREVIEAD